MKKIMLILAGLLVLAGLWWGIRSLSRLRGAGKDKPVQTARAELRDIKETIEVLGELTPAMLTDIKSEVSGRMAKLLVKDGDAVEQNQLLVELDQSELISQKEESLRSVEAAQLQVERAQRNYDRFRQLHTQDYVTEKDYQDAQTDLELAKNNLEIQQARLQTLEEKLAKTVIRATHAGIVINCNLTEGEVIVGASAVNNGTTIMQVADLDKLVVKVEINEVDVAKMTNGMPVSITFDSLPGIVATGQVSKISPTAKKGEKENRFVRTFPAEVLCAAVDPRIKPGISADVIVPIAAVTQVVAVTVASVFSEGTNKVAFVKKDGGFERVTVEPGINDAQYVEIVKGLAAGDEVALTRPADFLQEREADLNQRKDERRNARNRGLTGRPR
jgi:HlyD family secretion protein